MKYVFLSAMLFLVTSCGNYSFSGKSIPSGVKNAQLLVFEDNSGRYDLDLPEILRDRVTQKIEDYNYFEIENSSAADSKIFGTIRSYSENFVSQTRDEIADNIYMTMSVEVNFYDNNSQDFIVKSLNISETEYYDPTGGDSARDSAFETLIEKLSDSIVIGLSSNW
ncbi:MAG: hypothetical protein JXN63_02065 [Candidatus Delongbacteria bacterium]|nr:hypothetical protein [Candidatus Delongbacteria bacterium]